MIQFGPTPDSGSSQARSGGKSPKITAARFHNHYERRDELFKNKEEPKELYGWGGRRSNFKKKELGKLIQAEGQ